MGVFVMYLITDFMIKIFANIIKKILLKRKGYWYPKCLIRFS